MMKPDLANAENPELVSAATAGDEAAFASLTRNYRRELHIHCYRMLANFEDAEDIVQETLLRAWQRRATFEGRAPFRSWLYRIATNACLDFLQRKRRQIPESQLRTTETGLPLPPEVPWLQPYPDRLLDQVAPTDGQPDSKVVARENIELAYLVALQFLPPKQRATLILCDVLDWSALETASLLGTSVPAVNSALRRARTTLSERRLSSSARTASATDQSRERALLQEYVDATERCDAGALVRLLREDAMFSMPPQPEVFAGNRAVVQSWVDGGFGAPPFDDFKCLVTYANTMPSVVNYVRRPGDRVYRPFAVDVLRIDNGMIAEITAFDLTPMLEAFALPETIQ